ncbi:hypothetical protein PILCRDRAFT_255837 [Piloderma croceum F 1598]|uniref:DUF6533 domain-containing protein n=1 Tax=Piloderma croceum (strain F 1598) TaxID=765440 RepID=A0A0C3CF66_PILCF|nr:hypothetical protein PILCRDRAFT_255837 [Piloderma croceum F 1598]
MVNDSSIPPEAILNPYTPLAFLPPEFAGNYEIIRYVHVATLAAYTWDWLMSMPEEYAIVRNMGITAPNIVYFLSRVGTFGSGIGTFLIVAPIDNCEILKYVQGGFGEIGIPATSLLFFFRIRAVYRHSRIITTIFGIFWLAIAGLSIFIMLSITSNRIPYTRYCVEDITHTYTAVPILLTAVNDTFVFLAISYRMVSSAMVESTWRARTKSFFTGDGLLYLSKALLQSGQVYYFVTIGTAISASVLILCGNIPEARPILATPYFALGSAMACRVFRIVIFGVMKDTQMDTLDIVNFYRSTTSDPRHRDDGNDQRGRSSKFEIFVAVEASTTMESNDEVDRR